MRRLFLLAAFLLAAGIVFAAPPLPTRQPIRRVADLNLGETQEVQFANGTKATVRLADVAVTHDTVSGAVRSARVRVEVNGTPVTLGCALYNLPVTVAGVQIDCSMVKAFNDTTNRDTWHWKRTPGCDCGPPAPR